MTAEKSYEDREEEDYQTVLLRHMRASVRSIEGKVEEILEEFKEHFEDKRHCRNEWTPDDLYDNNRRDDW